MELQLENGLVQTLEEYRDIGVKAKKMDSLKVLKMKGRKMG